MHLSRPRLVPILVLALAMTTLLAVPTTASEVRSRGCFTDARDDAGGVPKADVTAVCLQYDEATPTSTEPNGPRIRVTIGFAEAIDPISDPAWSNDDTALSALLSSDGDPAEDLVVTLRRVDGSLAVVQTDGNGNAAQGCDVSVEQPNAQAVEFLLAPDCYDREDLRFGAMYAYESAEGQAVAMDRYPDSGLSIPMPRGDSPPFCDNRLSQDGEIEITRLRCGGLIDGTEPISQAVAVSQFVFDNLSTPVIEPYLGQWAVIVRDDNFADALAGSSLGFGQGPLLFAYSPTSGPALGQDHTRLPAATLQELLRVVPRGMPVYIMGGTAAIHEGVDAHLRELGYNPIRMAGASREETAALAAREVRRITVDFNTRNPGFPDTNMVLIANRDNWPDAVLAGQVGALWGMPILLNPATGEGHPATIAALDEIRPYAANFVGGSAVISSPTLNAIRDHMLAGGYGMGKPGEAVNSTGDEPWRQFCARSETEPFWVCRQGGDTRLSTAAAVSQFGREMIQRFGGESTLIPDTEVYVSGVPLAGGPDSDNYAYVLAASMMSGRFGGAVFLPTEDQTLTEVIKRSVCDLDRGKDTNGDGTPDTPFVELVELAALIGDTDKLTDAFGEEIRTLIEGGCPPEFQTVGGASSGLAAAD